MRQLLIILCCLIGMSVSAQKITHDFRNVSMSDALRYIQKQTTHYDIIFIYNDLEGFRITTDVRNKPVTDAIMEIMGSVLLIIFQG